MPRSKPRESEHRRRWKLNVLKALTGLGLDPLVIVRGAIGERAFNLLIEEAYREAPADPDKGAKIILSNMHSRHGDKLANKPKKMWTRLKRSQVY